MAKRKDMKPAEKYENVQEFMKKHTVQELYAMLPIPLYRGLRMIFPQAKADVLATMMYIQLGIDPANFPELCPPKHHDWYDEERRHKSKCLQDDD